MPQKSNSLLFYVLGILYLCLAPSFAVLSDNHWPIKTTEHPISAQDLSRINWLGPFFSTTYTEDNQLHSRTIRPFYVEFFDHKNQARDCYFLYPIFRKHITPKGTRWSLFNIIQKRSETDDPKQKRFRIFPLFSIDYNEESKSDQSASVFPVSGNINHFFGKDSVSWVLFPIYLKSQRGEDTSYSILWPIFHFQKGPHSGGGHVFPFGGHTWKKNDYDKQFYLWPLIYNNKTKLDQPTISISHGFLPFYTFEKTPNLESVCFIWPFFGYTHKQQPQYSEWRYLWPFFVQGRGELKSVNRWAPFYSHSTFKQNSKWWFLWPTLKIKTWEEANLNIRQTQLFYFLIWSQKQTSLTHPDLPPATKNHIWPLVSMWDNGANHKQLQIFSPFEVFFPHNKIIREIYTPLFALYRYQRTSLTHTYHSFLFNCITFEHSDKHKHFTLGPIITLQSGQKSSQFELLKGLVGFSQKENTRNYRLFWFSFSTKK